LCNEKSQIIDGLNTILTEIEKDKFDWSLDLEDVHMNIEARLSIKRSASRESISKYAII
jgi:argininosuccinate lyase